MKTKGHVQIRTLAQLSILIAIEVVLGVTPLGLIAIPPISVTLLHIPVIIGAIVLGPAQGMLLGGIFGLISMIKATTTAITPVDMMFSPFLSGKPLASLAMTLGARILLGLFAALIFKALQPRFKNNLWSIGISAVLATILHTVMVMGCLWAFFSAVPFMQIFLAVATLNSGLEILAAAVIVVPICKPLLKYRSTNK